MSAFDPVSCTVEVMQPSGSKTGTGYGATNWTALKDNKGNTVSPLMARIYRQASRLVQYDQSEIGRTDVDRYCIASFHRSENSTAIPDFDDGREYRFTPQTGNYAGKHLLAKRVRSYDNSVQVDCEKGTV